MTSVLDEILATFRAGGDILVLDGQNLTELPPQIGMLAGLEVLSLSNNRLTRLPAEIGQLSKLVELVVDENCLTELTPHIGRLTNLKILSLSHNSLTALPASIGDLASLNNLKLDHNRLVRLPPEIGKLAKLLRLNIQDNRLSELPAEFAQLDNLRDFDWEKWESNPRKGLPPRNVRNFIAHGNPWVYPPAPIMKEQVKAIQEYLKANPTRTMDEKNKPDPSSWDNPLLNGNGMNLERWASPPSADTQPGEAQSPTWTPPACPLPPPLPHIVSSQPIPKTIAPAGFRFESQIDVPKEAAMEARLRKEFPELSWVDHAENWDSVRIEGSSQNAALRVIVSRKESPGPFWLLVLIGDRGESEARKLNYEVIRRLTWALIGWSQFPLPAFQPRRAAEGVMDRDEIAGLRMPLEGPQINIYKANADILISRTLVEALSLHAEVLDPWAKTLSIQGASGDDDGNRDALLRGENARTILRQSVSVDKGEDLQTPLVLVRPAHVLVGELLELGLAEVVLYGTGGRAPGSGRAPKSIKVHYHFGSVGYTSYSGADGEGGDLGEILRIAWQRS